MVLHPSKPVLNHWCIDKIMVSESLILPKFRLLSLVYTWSLIASSNMKLMTCTKCSATLTNQSEIYLKSSIQISFNSGTRASNPRYKKWARYIPRSKRLLKVIQLFTSKISVNVETEFASSSIHSKHSCRILDMWCDERIWNVGTVS